MNCCCSRLRIQPMYSVMQAAPCSLLLHVQRFARVLWLILFISFHFALSLNAIICANNLLQMGNHYFFLAILKRASDVVNVDVLHATLVKTFFALFVRFMLCVV